MKVDWRRFVFSSVLMAASAPTAGEQQGVYRRIDPLVVCIESQFNKGVVRAGSGFFVAPGVIATVSHQVAAATRIVVHLPNGTTRNANPIASAKASDIALVAVPGFNSDYLPLQSRRAELGEEVFTIGCPLGFEHSLTQGVVSHPGRIIDGKRLIQTNLVVNLGNSGGPLIDKNGKVLGLIYGYLKGASGLNFVIPIDQVLALMRQRGLNVELLATPEIYQLWNRAQATEDVRTQISLYGEIIEKAPWLAEGFYNQGLAYYKTGEYNLARERYETAVSKRPSYYQAYTNLGLTLYQLGQYPKARDTLVKAITIKPDYALAYLNLGIVYKQGLMDEQSAQRSFRRFLELSPASAEATQVRQWLRESDKAARP